MLYAKQTIFRTLVLLRTDIRAGPHFRGACFITSKGEADGVFMSMAAFEEREKKFQHRDMICAAEFSRLNGEPRFTPEQLHQRMEALLDAYEG